MASLRKLRLCILSNEDPFDHDPWIFACEKYSNIIDYSVIDLTSDNWLSSINNFSPDLLLLKPSGRTSVFRTMYQERLDILVNDLRFKSYPSFNEVRIYENKRFFAYWACANSVPHPKTWVFYSEQEALKWANNATFPVVGKLNVGASGKGVVIINNKNELNAYIRKSFKTGIRGRIGPKLKRNENLLTILRKLSRLSLLVYKLKTYKAIATDKQSGFVIFQEFISHEYEWRVVRIGNSFFAHKKVKIGFKASGSLVKIYENPSYDILNFVRELTDQYQFSSVAVDIFESHNGYLINEIQCIFGQSDQYQMLVDGKPGRYKFLNGVWQFEEGDFASNRCFDLRIESILNKLGYLQKK